MGRFIVQARFRVALAAVGLLLGWLRATDALAQTAPVSPDRPWQAPAGEPLFAPKYGPEQLGIDPNKTYTLSELIDLAESHNPETRVAWEQARARAAELGIARSAWFPTLAAVALSRLERDQLLFGNAFVTQSTADLRLLLQLNYRVFDFGERTGRIDAAKAELLAANFAFNDTHRKIIYDVQQAYYELLNASGQEDAARASLTNALTVQRAAEDRLSHGLTTLPDVLEARSATAQAAFQVQTVLGTKDIARGDLATALGASPVVMVQIQPIDELPIADATGDRIDQAIDRALKQRPDLMRLVADVRSASARVEQARAAYYPTLDLEATPGGHIAYGLQLGFPAAQKDGFVGAVSATLSWTLFDGGGRSGALARARAELRTAEAQVEVARDQVANEVWAAYSNLNTAFHQRRASLALLEAAGQSYAAALDSYKNGVRSLLDVTSAQRTLAQAYSTDVLARTRVLASLADLAFRTADSMRFRTRNGGP
jgi:outer membrane protein TolC